MWVRPVNMGAHWLFCLVSIHAPVWVRRKSRGTALKASLFQFTHPCGCDPYRRHGLAQDGVFQFTHPCGCDLLLALREPSPFVSIHAPVWVRPTRYGYKCFYLLFQFTHPCGCDRRIQIVERRGACFNSRTRVGATLPPLPDRTRGKRFNSRTRVGATRKTIDYE